MVRLNLRSIGDKMSAFLSIACDGSTGYGQFQSQVEFDGGINHGVKPEDLLLSVGVLGIEANPDPGIHVGGQFRAAKEEGVCFCALIQDDARDNSPFDNKIEACSLKLFFETEDPIEDAGFVGIGLLKAKGQDFHSGSFKLRGESGRRAICSDADFLADNDSSRISESIKNPVSNVIDDTAELDELALLTEIGASFIPGIGGEKGAVGGQDLKGEQT